MRLQHSLSIRESRDLAAKPPHFNTEPYIPGFQITQHLGQLLRALVVASRRPSEVGELGYVPAGQNGEEMRMLKQRRAYSACFAVLDGSDR